MSVHILHPSSITHFPRTTHKLPRVHALTSERRSDMDAFWLLGTCLVVFSYMVTAITLATLG